VAQRPAPGWGRARPNKHATARHLSARIEQRLIEAERSSPAVLMYNWRAAPGRRWVSHPNAGTHQLDYSALLGRSLWIQVDESRAVVRWTWAQNEVPLGLWNEVDMLDFDFDLLERLIRALVVHDGWDLARVPDLEAGPGGR
jgi:hypothetical protein